MTQFPFVLALLEFAAPALAVALVVSMAGHWFGTKNKSKRPTAQVIGRRVAINFVACLGTLLLGFWWFGSDGKMASYLGLVAVAATVQWAWG
jgi:hypothetical protein